MFPKFKTKYFLSLIFISCVLFLLFLSSLSSCIASEVDAEDSGGLKIVATLFPQYDFARQIAGDKANITLLLPPGTESHGFDPKPGDMHEIYKADLFIYTGAVMEPWAGIIIKGIKNPN